ncbi:MAG TPA: hypothetical protein VIV57_20460, partial [Anaeromyxobacter sp.]
MGHRRRAFCRLARGGTLPAPRDVTLLFVTRALRMFAYGLASVVLVLHLRAAGIGQARVGLLITLTLLGDTAVSLLVTT